MGVAFEHVKKNGPLKFRRHAEHEVEEDVGNASSQGREPLYCTQPMEASGHGPLAHGRECWPRSSRGHPARVWRHDRNGREKIGSAATIAELSSVLKYRQTPIKQHLVKFGRILCEFRWLGKFAEFSKIKGTKNHASDLLAFIIIDKISHNLQHPFKSPMI